MSATIYDVAQRAGVSVKTVSRVMNGDAPVSGATRAAVRAAMEGLSYAPSRAARALRSGRSGLVGLITGAMSISAQLDAPEGLPELLIVRGVQRAFEGRGLTLMIADTGGRPERAAALAQTFLQHRAEGLICAADHHQRAALGPLSLRPLVLVNCFDDAGTPAVLPDDEGGQRALVRTVVAAGHQRIGYLMLRAGVTASALRGAGYRAALAEAGIPYDPALARPCDFDGPEGRPEAVAEEIARLLALPDPPSIICCGNDKMAVRAYAALRALGLRIPEDISVAGYDNHRLIAETLHPPLTTADLPYEAMGERAARRLMALISGESREPFGPELVSGPVRWRGSVKSLARAHFSTSQGEPT